jgi:hypothetical protein
MTYARIIGTGGYLPEKIMTNHDLEAIVDTSDQWIRERTGIEQRHIAGEGETTVDLAEKASRQAIEAAGIDASEIDLIVLATSTPDKIFPSSACILQARLDIHGCPAFDIQAVCTGFVYALTGGLHRLCLRAHRGREIYQDRQCEESSGGRRRGFLAHSKLGRPYHLRTVRRWRRRGCARRQRRDRHFIDPYTCRWQV